MVKPWGYHVTALTAICHASPIVAAVDVPWCEVSTNLAGC